MFACMHAMPHCHFDHAAKLHQAALLVFYIVPAILARVSASCKCRGLGTVTALRLSRNRLQTASFQDALAELTPLSCGLKTLSLARNLLSGMPAGRLAGRSVVYLCVMELTSRHLVDRARFDAQGLTGRAVWDEQNPTRRGRQGAVSIPNLFHPFQARYQALSWQPSRISPSWTWGPTGWTAASRLSCRSCPTLK
jgi:hypothetical protein